uniref:3-hydroxyacyl-CoA dehydrogenase n=1 Tax=Globodera rostochiensis TaxID=31243 RepID=A0A914HUM9_GLORO
MLDRFLGHFLSLSQIWGGGRKTGKYRRPRARRVEMFSFVKSAQRFYSTEPMVKNLTANVKVVLVDQNQAIIDKAKSGIESSIKRVAKKQFENDSKKQNDLVTRVLSNISLSTNIGQAVSEADLVIEAVVENLDVKRKLFAQVESSMPRTAKMATNTSSLKLADIAANLKRKDCFGGLHFFNPVPVMKLLEVVRFDSTSEETFDVLLNYGKSIGKTTVICKDTPGFIVNRLLVPYMLEAMRMLDRSDATKEDIDQAMKLGAGYPMGPFQLADYVGLDTTQSIVRGWNEKYPEETLFHPIKCLDNLVADGKFGLKSGEGFYKYTK